MLDPSYGLKVTEWDFELFSVEVLTELLATVAFINSKSSFHLVLFCEWSSYPEYVKTINNAFGPRVNHIAPHVLLKKIFPCGQDLGNAVEVAVYARIGDNIQANLKAKPDGTNIFGSADEAISFLRDQNNKVLNPAQKPYEAIKTLVETYTLPGEYVLDLFAGTGQVTCAACELGFGSVSVEKDPI